VSWPHWIIIPIVLPLMAGAALLLIERSHKAWVAPISLFAVGTLLAVNTGLLLQADTGTISSYLLSNWKAPFGIALALDRLSALMLLLTSVVAAASLLYARSSGTDQRGPHFHSLFQFQLMGLNGAFLTADLFNLFVFFEVLLISSYGLLLHGAGKERLQSSVHYVIFNLIGSALFLIAVSLLYGLTGTLNMADLAVRVPQLGAENALLAQTACLLLLVVFCVKAALLPLYFWLPDSYGSATAPVAALFAMMTKVGVYATARMFTLVFGDSGGATANVAAPWLTTLALGTIVLGAIGALAARQLRGLIAYLVIGSAGTLLLTLGLAQQATVGAGLFYIVNSTLVAAALFLLADQIRLHRAVDGAAGDALQAGTFDSARTPLGILFFALAIAAAGLPPLAGFLGKSMILSAAWSGDYVGWVWSVILLAGLLIMLALARAGSTLFWKSVTQPALLSKRIGVAPWLLLAALVCNSVFAGPLSRYTHAAAAQLFERQQYISAVLGQQPVPPLYDIRKEMKAREAAAIRGGKP
jgi:multicomponent K+:H+ antiporter subunit D